MPKKTISLLKLLSLVVVAPGVVAFAQKAQPAAPADTNPVSVAPSTDSTVSQLSTEQALEVFGWSIGRDLGFGMLSYTPEQKNAIVRGFSASAEGKPSPFSLEQADQAIRAFMQAKGQEFMEKQRAEIQKQAAENKVAAEKFFNELKNRKGISTTASGLMYEVISEGSGASPKPADTVVVNYKGTLIDGTSFDASAPGKPAEFVLEQVIPGWVEGLQLMKKGGKAKFYIPSDLAYGDEGRPGAIPPAAPLIFEVELVDIKVPSSEKAEAPKVEASQNEAGAAK